MSNTWIGKVIYHSHLKMCNGFLFKIKGPYVLIHCKEMSVICILLGQAGLQI